MNTTEMVGYFSDGTPTAPLTVEMPNVLFSIACGSMVICMVLGKILRP